MRRNAESVAYGANTYLMSRIAEVRLPEWRPNPDRPHRTFTASSYMKGERLQHVSAAEIGPETINLLGSLDVEAHVGVLLGAGASAAAGLPDWNTFAVELLTTSGAITDRATAKAFLAEQDPAIVAEAAKNAASSEWSTLLKTALYGEAPASPAPLHNATAALAGALGHDAISLFTLNYDNLLEVALHDVLEELGHSTEVFPRRSARPRASRGNFEVHHLHGYLPPDADDATSVILTLSDYNVLGQQNPAWQASALAESVQKGPLILAGTSYRDPDIRQWIHHLTSDDSGAEVLVFLAREGMKLDRVQFRHIENALKAQWSALGVQVIATHDYEDAAQALRELPHINELGYQVPSARAATQWEKQLADFSTWQRADSEELEHDLKTLREQLPNFDNLTLWLADGEGGLVRWSANDRIYRHPDHLRRAVPGHDSAWIAGQCLGRNDILVKQVDKPASTARLHSVAAAPVVPELPGGPPLPSGVISAASTSPTEDVLVDEVDAAFAELSEKWSLRLQERSTSS